MFERFTDRARRVLVLAQEEARDLNHNFIGTEHILLGLVHDSDGVAAKALGPLGISLERVREKVGETIAPAASPTTGAPFTPRAKKVLELSLREALQLGHNYIGTEHVLLGLVREGEGVGAQVLVGLGADLSRVREQVIQLVADDRPPETAGGAEVSSAERRAGPRCPACRVRLDGHVGYRVLPVPPVDKGGASEAIDVVFVHCLLCGVVIAHTPAGEVGERIMPHLVTRSPAAPQRGQVEPTPAGTTAAGPARTLTPEEAALGAFAPEEGAQVVGVRYDQPDHAVVQIGFPGKSAFYFVGLFLHEDGWSMEAPAGPARVVAEGVTPEGVRWTLEAGGSDESYSTMLRTEDAVGIIDSGGMGGPKLWGAQRLNVYSGGNPERGPRGVVVRCDPSIVRLVLVQEPGLEMDLTRCGDGVVDGMRFGLALVDPSVHLREVVGSDSDGAVVERFDLRGHDNSWHRNR
jgi:Clp amino terminal domain, pathogenicity island component